MLVEDESLTKVDVWGVGGKSSLLKDPIELSSFPALPDHKPDTTQNEGSDPYSYNHNRPIDSQVEVSAHSVTLAMQLKS